MEELRTTEILEREILEDARKKAERSLKNAEVEIGAMEKEWAVKREKAFADLDERYRKRLADARRETESSLPLELKRKTIEYYDRILGEELQRYFSSFDSRRTAETVRPFIERSSNLFSGKKLILLFGGMLKVDAEQLVRSVCSSCTVVRSEPSDSIHGVVLELEDRRMRLTATLELIRQILLDEKREELYSNFFEGKD